MLYSLPSYLLIYVSPEKPNRPTDRLIDPFIILTILKFQLILEIVAL